jgi:D-alanine-D-alanine ligase
VNSDTQLKQSVAAISVESLGRVAVIMGGIAAEREVSLKSGQAVYNALKNQKVDVDLIDVTNIEQLVGLKGHYDRVFNIIHGRWGEDGGVQSILDSLQVPYTGSDMASSALSMDKLRTKWLWQGVGLETPAFLLVSKSFPFSQEEYSLGFPVIVKPVREGSSIGMKKANNMVELMSAIEFAQQYDAEILVEKWISGREFTCSIVGDVALPLIELKTTHDFYDFDAKYKSNDTQYICPVQLDEQLEERIKKLSIQAFNVLGTKGWGRVDLMLDEEAQPWLIELNTVPGMTDHSLVPMAAKSIGLSFEELALLIVGMTRESDD